MIYMDSKKIKYQKNVMSALKHAEKLSMMLSRILDYNLFQETKENEKINYEMIEIIRNMSEDADKIEKSLKVLSDDIKAGAKK